MTSVAKWTRPTIAILFGWVIATTPVLGSPVAAQDPGDQLWVSRYDGPRGWNDEGNVIGVGPDGSRVFVAGDVNGIDGDFGVVAYDATTGDQVWETVFGGDDGEIPTALTVSPQGDRVYISGSVDGGCWSYGTLALDGATGAQLWFSVYDVGCTDYAVAMALSPAGTRVFVTGYSLLETNDYATVAYDAFTGAQLWASRYGRPVGSDVAQDIAVSPDGAKVFVTGHTETSRDRNDYATVAHDAATGATLWARRFDSGSHADYARAIGVSPDGTRVFVTGQTDVAFTTVAYDPATGARLWVRRFLGAYPTSLVVSPDGARIFVTGYTGDFGNSDFATVAHDPATGALLWSSLYDGFGSEDYASDIKASPDGAMVFVTGEIDPPADDEDYATVAYDALTGDQVWASWYNGPARSFDSASSLAVAPDGASVFVTGYSTGVGTQEDFATVAYSA
jgi:outer membrane protein assembly factor BamB